MCRTSLIKKKPISNYNKINLFRFLILLFPLFTFAQSKSINLKESCVIEQWVKDIKSKTKNYTTTPFYTQLQQFNFIDAELQVFFIAESKGNYALGEHLIIPIPNECNRKANTKFIALGSPAYPKLIDGAYNLEFDKAVVLATARFETSGKVVLFPSFIDDLKKYGNPNKPISEWYDDTIDAANLYEKVLIARKKYLRENALSDNEFNVLQTTYKQKQNPKKGSVVFNEFGELVSAPKNEKWYKDKIIAEENAKKERLALSNNKEIIINEVKDINTEYDEYSPMLTGDGYTLFFLREGDPDNSSTYMSNGNNEVVYHNVLPNFIINQLKKANNDNPAARKLAFKKWHKSFGEQIDEERKDAITYNLNRSGEKQSLNDKITFDSDIYIWKKHKKYGTAFTTQQDYPLNDWKANFIIGISSDGKRIYTSYVDELGDNRGKGDGLKKYPELTYKGGSLPYKLSGNSIQLEKSHNVFQVSHTLTLNNNALLSSFEGDDTHGKGDIYISFRKENNLFSYAENIGMDINTSQDEGSPFLAADLKTLYFRRKINDNVSHIFFSRRLDDTWKKWSKPVKLPSPINLPNRKSKDPYVTADGKRIYFSSNRKTGKDLDIYYAEIEGEIAPLGSKLIKGKTVADGVPLTDVKIEIRPAESQLELKDISYSISNTDGSFESPFRTTEKLVITAKKKGYISEVIVSDSLSSGNKNLEMYALKKGNRIELKNILFVRGKATFLKESLPDLNNLLRAMKDNTSLKILIEGHTDKSVNSNANRLLTLSIDRAKQIKSYLISRGIKAKRIKTTGFGGSKPKYSNKIKNERMKNRRVEIVIL
ncbi:MAG: OmpA family protein [Lacinutrix sp.]|uniref:OmpA family protein n=1 Tax=Lacinutrix sp. TaxID=1937692 RepID=UPI0030A3BCEC